MTDPPRDPTNASPDPEGADTPDLHDPAHDEEALMGLAAELLAAGPGLVRLMTGVGWRMTSWAVSSTRVATERLLRAAVEGESVGHLTSEAVDTVRQQALQVLGILDEGEDPAAALGQASHSTEHLRERGRRLLDASADVHLDQPTHPAYDRILDDLAPDEGRILRLLRDEGPQPSVDVRTAGTPVAQIGSEMVAPGLTMIGAHAGVRYEDRVPAYLNNLFRLGLIWFSREPVQDLVRYQVLEAQPDVAEALRRAGRGRTVRRSLHLTPFGEDFCRTCLPEDSPLGPT